MVKKQFTSKAELAKFEKSRQAKKDRDLSATPITNISFQQLEQKRREQRIAELKGEVVNLDDGKNRKLNEVF